MFSEFSFLNIILESNALESLLFFGVFDTLVISLSIHAMVHFLCYEP